MITTKIEAMKWFLANSSGTLVVQNEKGESKECDCYLDAEEFLNN